MPGLLYKIRSYLPQCCVCIKRSRLWLLSFQARTDPADFFIRIYLVEDLIEIVFSGDVLGLLYTKLTKFTSGLVSMGLQKGPVWYFTQWNNNRPHNIFFLQLGPHRGIL